MPTVEDLGKLVKTKYPQYGSIPDADLGRKVKAKYPQYAQFTDIAASSSAPAAKKQTGPPESAWSPGTMARSFGRSSLGILQGAGQSAYNLMDIATGGYYSKLTGGPGKSFDPIGPEGNIGKTGEQIGEFFIPVGMGKFKLAANAPRWARMLMAAGGEAANNGIKAYVQTKDPKAALEAAGIGGAFGAAGEAVSGKLGPLVRNVLNPKEKKALEFAQKRGIPASLGQRTGEPGLQRVERSLENFPGSAARTREFYQGQEQALAKTGGDLAAEASPTKTNDYGAGTLVQKRLGQRVMRLKAQADKLYSEVREGAAANRKTVQTGAQTSTSPILDAQGKPISTTRPVMKAFETPVNLQPIRASLKPVYEELERSLPEARRASSPAFRALQQVMQSEDSHMNAMDFDRFLSAVKSLSREGKSDLLSSRSQGIAKLVIQNGEREFRAAMSGAGPGVMDKLTKARTAVRSYYETDNLLNSLKDEPAALYKNLVSGGDVMLNTLQELRKVAPAEVSTVGRTFLEGLIGKAAGEGGFSRSAGVMADWQRMGPETKQLLFGSRLTGDLDNFMLAAKRLTPATGSPTAARLSAIMPFGIGAEIIRYLASGQPEAAGAAAAGGVALEYGIPNVAARILFSPNGARLLTKTITLKPGSPAWGTAIAALNTMAHRAQREQGAKKNQ